MTYHRISQTAVNGVSARTELAKEQASPDNPKLEGYEATRGNSGRRSSPPFNVHPLKHRSGVALLPASKWLAAIMASLAGLGMQSRQLAEA